MSQLLDYLNLLDKDAPASAAHRADPKAAMTQHGLNEAEQNAVLSGDSSQIAKLLGIDADEFPVPQTTNTPFN